MSCCLLLLLAIAVSFLIFVMPTADISFVRPRPQFFNGHTSVGVLSIDVTSFVFILAESPKAKSGILIRELLDTTTQNTTEPVGGFDAILQVVYTKHIPQLSSFLEKKEEAIVPNHNAMATPNRTTDMATTTPPPTAATQGSANTTTAAAAAAANDPNNNDNNSVLDISEQTQRPVDNAFNQQRVNAWHPILDPVFVIIGLFYLGVIMVPTGACMMVD